jgi:hypothetical protein
MANPDDYNPRETSRGFVWLKFRTDLIDESEFMQLTDLAKAVYFEAYFLAGRSDAGGLILASERPATIGKIAWSLRRPEADLQNALDELRRAGLVDLDNGQVTIERFAKEQGPSMADQRVQWATRQAKRRARARGEVWPEPDSNAEPEPDKNQNREGSKDLNDPEPEQTKDLKPLQNKTKRVTSQSQDNHAGVTRDKAGGGGLDDFAQSVLESWQSMTGKRFSKNDTFLGMVQDWLDEGVNLDHVQEGIKQAGQANTPLFLRDLVVNIKNASPEIQKEKDEGYWRDLYNKLKEQKLQGKGE